MNSFDSRIKNCAAARCDRRPSSGNRRFQQATDPLQIHRVHAAVDFLNFLSSHAKRFPSFEIHMKPRSSIYSTRIIA
jgi:hypothetical protein